MKLFRYLHNYVVMLVAAHLLAAAYYAVMVVHLHTGRELKWRERVEELAKELLM